MTLPLESSVSNSSEPLDQYRQLFEELIHLKQSEAQATFLNIGGRGYYENPASDLLQFFFRPDNAHGLGTLAEKCADAAAAD